MSDVKTDKVSVVEHLRTSINMNIRNPEHCTAYGGNRHS